MSRRTLKYFFKRLSFQIHTHIYLTDFINSVKSIRIKFTKLSRYISDYILHNKQISRYFTPTRYYCNDVSNHEFNIAAANYNFEKVTDSFAIDIISRLFQSVFRAGRGINRAIKRDTTRARFDYLLDRTAIIPTSVNGFRRMCVKEREREKNRSRID